MSFVSHTPILNMLKRKPWIWLSLSVVRIVLLVVSLNLTVRDLSRKFRICHSLPVGIVPT